MKKIIKFLLCIAAMLIAVYLIYDYYKDKAPVSKDQDLITNNEGAEKIKRLSSEYNNNEIVMFFEIPEVISIPIVQTENNEFYLSHDIYKNESDNGTPFLDFRNKSLGDRKLIIYGDSSFNPAFPLSNLYKYKDNSFYNDHSTINIYTEHGKRNYKVLSVFFEKEDLSYLDLSGFPGSEYLDHLLSLKSKSIYDTGVEVSNESKVLVIETCATEKGCDSDSEHLVVVAKEEKPSLSK